MPRQPPVCSDLQLFSREATANEAFAALRRFSSVCSSRTRSQAIGAATCRCADYRVLHCLEMELIESSMIVTEEPLLPASELELIVGDSVPVTSTCCPR
jgi:hypothetical protein